MVTTRSADRQATNNGRTEELTLRSKPEESSPSVRASQPETPTPSSARRKTKVMVNVPPPRKRTRLSYDGSGDVESADPDLNVVELPVVTQEEQPAVSEVPDSQETITELEISQISKEQSRSTRSRESLPPQTKQSAKRKRKVAGAQKLVISSTTVAGAGHHKRFGSGEPAGEDDIAAVEDDIHEPAKQALSDDEDDAPEVVTSKTVTKSSTPRQKRTTRTKNATRTFEEAKTETTTAAADQITPSRSTEVEDEQPGIVLPPVLKVDTEQDPDTSIAIASDDSQDSAFVTARTTRHHDIFATPLGGTPQLPSPTRDQLDVEIKPIVPTRRADAALMDLNQGLSTMQLSRTKPDRTNLGSTNTTPLPSKPSNSLEHYRRQILRTRAEKVAGTTRGKSFKLQEEWSGKRRKFVVGY